MQKECIQCQKIFEKPINESLKNWLERRRYCSVKCQNLARRGKKPNANQLAGLKIGWYTKGKSKSRPAWNKGLSPNQETREKIRAKLKGHKPWNTGLGIASEEKLQRLRSEYKEWRLKVHQRCHFTCVLCGYKSHTRINGKSDIVADHIKPFALFPSLRLTLENGRTLCIPCHRQTETYGMNKLYGQL